MKVEVCVFKCGHIYNVHLFMDHQNKGIIMQMSEDIWENMDVRFIIESALDTYLKAFMKASEAQVKILEGN